MKRLTKCESDRKICGVCSGIARYFDIDPTPVRLVWAITCFWGVGIAAYIVAALIIPGENEV